MKKLLFIISITLLLVACSSKPTFNEVEGIQARYFIEALELDNESIKISNSQTPYGTIDEETVSQILELKMKSLNLAKKIPFEVLEKMHPDLPVEYSGYKVGLQLRINNLIEGDSIAEVEGSLLIKDWSDWYSKNIRNIKIPNEKRKN